jgi:predicted small lipoprotein YifL
VIQPPLSALVRPAPVGRRPARRALAGLAALGVLVAALALAGCGRKSGLDAPPMAAAGDMQTSGQPASATAPAPATAGKPVAAAPEKRNPFLDWLID